jgi:AAA15 family ATPase/GTPase
MKLTRVEFIHYRSISEDALDIERDITCLVGINEAGKSNALLALEKADTDEELTVAEYSRHSDGFGDPDNSPELRLWFDPDKNEISGLKEIFGGDMSTLLLVKTTEGYRVDFPVIDYKKSKFYTSPIPIEGEEVQKDNPKLTDEEMQNIRVKVIEELEQNYIPRFLRFDSVNFNEYFLPPNGEIIISQFITKPEDMKPIKNLLALGEIVDFSVLQANDENKRLIRDTLLNNASKKINEEILRVVWPVESVEVRLSAEGDILKIRLQEKDKTSPFRPDERSRGLQWALAFNIYFLAETKGELQQSVLLIDEPGIFLHIDAQKKLLEKTFPKINENGNQIIYTTHLPYLIDSHFPERIRILEKKNENTIIGNKAWSEGEFGKIPEPVRTALGLRWAELFNIVDKNVIVEGPSDQIILRAVHSVFGKDNTIEFLPAYGYKKFPSVLAIVYIEEKQGFGIIDGDESLEELRKKCATVSIPEDRMDTIPILTNNKDIITIEDILPEDLFRQAVFKVYYPFCLRRKNCSLVKADIPTEYPRVKKVEEFFATKFHAQKHAFAKMEFARAVAEIITEIDVKKGEVKWNPVKNLVGEIEKKY